MAPDLPPYSIIQPQLLPCCHQISPSPLQIFNRLPASRRALALAFAPLPEYALVLMDTQAPHVMSAPSDLSLQHVNLALPHAKLVTR